MSKASFSALGLRYVRTDRFTRYQNDPLYPYSIVSDSADRYEDSHDRVAYVTSKGAVAAMTRAMALDHAHQNIRINAVAPGTIESPYYTEILKKAPDPEALRQSLAARQPMNRMGTPLEIANAVVYLASDEASFCTGSVLFADGGWTAR